VTSELVIKFSNLSPEIYQESSDSLVSLGAHDKQRICLQTVRIPLQQQQSTIDVKTFFLRFYVFINKKRWLTVPTITICSQKTRVSLMFEQKNG